LLLMMMKPQDVDNVQIVCMSFVQNAMNLGIMDDLVLQKLTQIAGMMKPEKLRIT